MAVASAISEEVYLRTAFDPDCDFIDGLLEERNLGPKDHSAVQKALIIWFWKYRKELRVSPLPEVRVRVQPTVIGFETFV